MKQLPLFLALILYFSPLLRKGEGGEAFAQIYPVQLTAQLIPPYSGYLVDYADPASEKLKLVLQFNDFTVPQYNVRLRFEIKGNGFSIATKQIFNPPPITVYPGVPLLISSTELAPYLNSANLDFNGISQGQYESGKSLPEGHYSICVTAYDYYLSNTQVSNDGCTQAWFTLSDPPLLNLPFCGSDINPQTPQNILFQWTPMNMGSPNSAMNTEYDLELWEMKPDSTVDPSQLVMSAPPIFKITTQQPLFSYGLTEPELTLYMKYAWRVRARDLNGYDLFKNKGYSQVCTFRYGNAGKVLDSAYALTLTAQGITHRMGYCAWNLQTVFSKYLLQVRKQGTQYWFDFPSNVNYQKVTNLEPNTTYEARVRGEGSDIPIGEWSNTAVFTTLKDPVYACNDQSSPTDPLQGNPLQPLFAVPGLVIQSGQFEVMTTEIESSGSPGWYKGKGYARVLGGLPLAVKWKHIYIDDNNRHQQGVIEAITKGIKSWMEQYDLEQAEQNATYVNGTIDTAYISGNQVCVVLQGNPTAVCYDLPDDANMMVIRDEEGNQYTVSTNPPPPTIEGPSSYVTISDDSLAASDSLKVIFEASTAQKYGFDKKEYAPFIPDYEAILLKIGKKYFVPWKSLGEAQGDEVLANLVIPNLNAGLLSFKTKNGAVLSSSPVSSTQHKVTLPGGTEAVYAWYGSKKIGKLNVISLKPLSKKVVVVPVNNTAIPSGSQGLSAALNDVFKQANVSWTVSTAPNFSYDLGSDGLEAANTTLMSKYSEEMRALRDSFMEADSSYDKNAYYLFAVPVFNDPSLKGYMVRGRSVGFFSASASTKDIAHELAHGAFGLEHTFPQISQGTSNNLMDYSTGQTMTYKQWMDIHNSKFIFNWFDSEEDGSCEFTAADNIVIFSTLNHIKKCVIGNLKMGVKNLPSKRSNKYEIKNTSISGVHYRFIRLYRDNNIITATSSPTPKTEISPKGKILAYQKQDYSPIGLALPYALIEIDGTVFIEVPTDRKDDIIKYLEDAYGKNILLFVNGYRPNFSLTGEEFANTSNNIHEGDIFGYWSGIDAEFINRIGTKKAVYADGHMGILYSNHRTKKKFFGSMSSVKSAYASIVPLPYSHETMTQMFLNYDKNEAGFSARRTNGIIAGNKMAEMMKKNIIPCTKDASGNIADTVDVVCHSFGFAYAQGMIDALRANNIKVKRYYIIAAENACSGNIDQNSFEEIWMYGSNEKTQKVWEQDGVAPQCIPVGLSPLKRAYIPDNDPNMGFLNSHYVNNYFWIFQRTPSQTGYVSKRK